MAIQYDGEFTGQNLMDLINFHGTNHAVERLIQEFDKLIAKDIFSFLNSNGCPDPLDHKKDIKQLTWRAVYIDIEKFRRGEKISDYTNPVGWVFRIQRRLCIKHLIRCKRQNMRTLDETLFQNFPDSSHFTVSPFENSPVESTHYKKEVLEIVREYFYTRPKEQRIAFELFINGFSHKEIAFFLNISPTVSRQWISRGAKSIRQRL